MASTAEHKLTAREKLLFGVLNTNLFSENSAKRTCFSSQNENNEKQKNGALTKRPRSKRTQ
jgi:hypothetical protein